VSGDMHCGVRVGDDGGTDGIGCGMRGFGSRNMRIGRTGSGVVTGSREPSEAIAMRRSWRQNCSCKVPRSDALSTPDNQHKHNSEGKQRQSQHSQWRHRVRQRHRRSVDAVFETQLSLAVGSCWRWFGGISAEAVEPSTTYCCKTSPALFPPCHLCSVRPHPFSI
jgi:hypothetical protein